MSRIALLDVNLLVALFDPDHVHHDLAHDWFAGQRSTGWATCPHTELGFVRVLSSPAYGSQVRRPTELVDRLAQLCASGGHTFWTDGTSIRDESLIRSAYVGGHRQITDVYLLAVAVKHGGCLATFDLTINRSAVVGATRDTLQVITSS